MRADYIDRKTARGLFRKMQPVNALICEICLDTGLRIDDVCALSRATLKYANAHSGWTVVCEQKTGKNRRIRFSRKHLDRMSWISGQVYVFENRLDPMKHRARQTVYNDLVKAGAGLRKQGINISPHSLRKCWAVEKYDQCGDIGKVQQALNHDSPATTMLYIMSRELTASQLKIKAKRPRKAAR